MSVVCAQHTQGSPDVKYIATVKGAAEALRPMVRACDSYALHMWSTPWSILLPSPPPPPPMCKTLPDSHRSSRTFLSVTPVCTPVSLVKAFGSWHWDTNRLAQCCPVRYREAATGVQYSTCSARLWSSELALLVPSACMYVCTCRLWGSSVMPQKVTWSLLGL